jgi:2'-5' RNA ligase
VIRAFAAIALPEAVRRDLQILQMGMPVPRTIPPESLHLTLVFLGEVPAPVLADVDAAFRSVSAPAFDVELRGVGMFGGSKPRVVFAGAGPAAPLEHLQAKLAAAARGAGIAIEARRFVPHVTLARLSRPPESRTRLERFVAMRADYAAPRFTVGDFRLYRSTLGGEGASYEELAAYPLSGVAATTPPSESTDHS